MKDKEKNNGIHKNYQAKYNKKKDCTSLDEITRKHPSEATEESENNKRTVPKNQNQHVNFRDNLQYHNIDSILTLTG